MSGVNERTKAAMAAYKQGHNDRVAAFPPFPPKQNPPPFASGGPSKRDIPPDHDYDPRSLKPMSKALWAASVGLGHALTAYRHLSRLKSTSVSPDGMLGGRGYVMTIKDARQKLYEACEALSAISDTLHDEITAPHWQPKLAQLDENDQEDVSRFVEESEDNMENPEGDAEEEIEKIEKANDKPGKPGKPGPEETASKTPGGGDAEAQEAKPAPPNLTKQASSKVLPLHLRVAARHQAQFVTEQQLRELGEQYIQEEFGGDAEAMLRHHDISNLTGNSSLPTKNLPGPRVDHLDPAEGTGPWGSFNDQEEVGIADAWQRDQGVGSDYAFPGEYENDLREAAEQWAQSTMPSDPGTETEGWDWGLGYGAQGQGAGDYANPSGEGGGSKGVWGPQSGLPGSPSISVNDTTPKVDQAINERHGQGLLPEDVAGPPARTDYYDAGPKDNLVQGEADAWAQSVLPGEGQAPVDIDLPLLDTDYVHEDTATPYVRQDYERNERPKREEIPR